jgi:hypothetical protein
MWKRVAIGIAALIFAAFVAVLFIPGAPMVVLGLVRRESFYRGMPTAYWGEELETLNHDRDAADALQAGGAEAVPVLRELLRSGDVNYRLSAAEILGKIGADARSAGPDLEDALQDDDMFVRFRARTALKQIDAGIKGEDGGKVPPKRSSP